MGSEMCIRDRVGRPPAPPPYPPQPPPAPWQPWPPALPSANAHYALSAASASAAFDPFGYECKGIVFQTLANGDVRCSLRTTSDLVVYTPEQQALEIANAASTAILGDYVFSYLAPPPPPWEPIGGACVEFYGTEYADLEPTGTVDLTMPPSDRVMVATSFEQPAECC